MSTDLYTRLSSFTYLFPLIFDPSDGSSWLQFFCLRLKLASTVSTQLLHVSQSHESLSWDTCFSLSLSCPVSFDNGSYHFHFWFDLYVFFRYVWQQSFFCISRYNYFCRSLIWSSRRHTQVFFIYKDFGRTFTFYLVMVVKMTGNIDALVNYFNYSQAGVVG